MRQKYKYKQNTDKSINVQCSISHLSESLPLLIIATRNLNLYNYVWKSTVQCEGKPGSL